MKITAQSKVTLIDNKQQEYTLSLSKPEIAFDRQLLIGKAIGDLFILIEDEETVEYKIIAIE